ncbi:hypothetical protein MKEN_00997700 [Mycena kentingensis (nom. inval.)]|nr:hypothetical protein MKEN_00997700 [Mycena kentingensis (nom. inval.)]
MSNSSLQHGDVGAAAAGLETQTAFTLDNTLGAVVIGFAGSCVVYGVLLTQGWTYYRQFGLDSLVWKFLVFVVIFLATVDQAFIGHFVYFYTLASAGNPFALLTSTTTWSIILQQAVGSIGGAIVKCAFASRVYRFSGRNPYVTGLIVLLSIGQLALSLIFTIRAFGLSSIPAVFQLKTLGTVSLGLGVVTDVVTAAALCFFIRRLRTGYKPTDSLVRRLVVDAINTGVVTSAVSLTTLFLFYFYTGNLIFAATFFLLSKLYGISFLATLNTRRAVRGRGTDGDGDTGYDENSKATPGTGIGGSKRERERAQEETNIFALGTRMPSFYENDAPGHAYIPHDPEAAGAYPYSLDGKAGGIGVGPQQYQPQQQDYSRGLHPYPQQHAF